MSLRTDKVVPGREERLGAGIAFGGSACALGKSKPGCLKHAEREFSQSGLCQMLPMLGMLLTLPDTAVIVHGGLGCSGPGINMNSSNIRLRNMQRGVAKDPDTRWISSNLTEYEVIHGGGDKLDEAIRTIHTRFQPKSIIVMQTCTPAIIGDDVSTIVDHLREELDVPILLACCEGFRTKVWATGYDIAFHALVHGFIEHDKEGRPSRKAPWQPGQRPRINLINLASLGKPDEDEITRMLNAIGIDVSIGPNYATREEFRRMTQADLTVSICPTHDDYFVHYLQEEYGIPAVLRDMPIGLENTRNWLLDIARHFGLEAATEQFIADETAKAQQAVQSFLPVLQGKHAFFSAGEFRALVTASLFQELGLEVVGLRSYHHDDFGTPFYAKLVQGQDGKDFPVDIANFQPFELTNLLTRIQPDLFVGHVTDNVWAAKLGLPTMTIFRIFDTYTGYRGYYEVARKAARVLRNPAFNRNLSVNAVPMYRQEWYAEDPFTYIKPGQEVA
ncbi:MAG TPA: nitrogenase component 1 [Armatimonadota bacterium]|jgi:nitrogenase molybdenum-iron protein alpha chain